MAEWHAKVPASAVVAVVPWLQQHASAPAELPIAPRQRPGARRLVMLLGVLVAIGSLAPLVLLWRSPSPGIVVNLIFTVLGAAVALGAVALVGSWHADAAREEHALAQWRTARPVRADVGTVIDREVTLGSDSGHVIGLSLLVRVGDQQLAAGWSARGRKPLLQPQVPGIGSPVRIWRSAAGPVLVEVADPTVVEPQDAR